MPNEVLSEEELALLNEDETGTETEAEETDDIGEPFAPAEEEEPTEKQDENADADKSEKPVLMAKDGEHTIPYEELEDERARVKELEQELANFKSGNEAQEETEDEEPDGVDFKSMTRTELREYRDYADDDDLAKLESFEDEQRMGRLAAKQAQKQDESHVQEFLTTHKEAFDADPDLIRVMDVFFASAQDGGKSVEDALEVVASRMATMGLIQDGTKKMAEKISGLENERKPHRSLAGATGVSDPKTLPDADGDVYAAEAVFNSMTPSEQEKWLAN